ncbi:HEPN domain-containing protein [Vibrio rotiferianus]
MNSIVNKRNSIIHHNDEASDITFSDLHTNIDTVLLYMKAIESTLSATAA